jgi:hypothetical protein
MPATGVRLVREGVSVTVPSMGQESDIEPVVACPLQQLTILSIHHENRIEAPDLSQERGVQREAGGI